MTDKTTSSAAFDSAPQATRAPKLVTRKGVVTSQLRGPGGQFGGKAPPEGPVPSVDRDANIHNFRGAPPTDFDAIQRLRDRARADSSRRARIQRVVAIGAIALCAFVALYFAGQFLR